MKITFLDNGMHLSPAHILHFIEQHCSQEQEIILAVSGGIDSMVLLTLFAEIQSQIANPVRVMHVNHGLSQNAQDWACFVEKSAHSLGFEFESIELQLRVANRQSLEEVARIERYDVIAKHAKQNAIVFTGHHQNDQTETFFIRLLRSSGLTGLASMEEISQYPTKLGRSKKLSIGRPLLDVNKESILAFANSHKLVWVEDESNEADDFDRNFLRRHIMPKFVEKWPNLASRVSTTTEMLKQDKRLLQEYVLSDLDSCIGKGFDQSDVLLLDKLTGYSNSRIKAILREYIFLQAETYPARAQLSQVVQQFVEQSPSPEAQVQIGEYRIRSFREQLYICQSNAEGEVSPSSIEALNSGLNVLPDNSLFNQIELKVRDSSLSLSLFELRWGCLNDKMLLNPNSGRKTVKQILKSVGCPSWQRQRVPLLYYNGQLVAVYETVSLDYQRAVNLKVS